MVLVLDTNVVVALFRPEHAHHEVARRWWLKTMAAGESFTVPDLVWAGVTRLLTNSRVFDVPATFEEAWRFAEAMMMQPSYLRAQLGSRVLDEFADLGLETKARGDLLTDAYIAACAAAYGGTVVTFDRDFRKFDGLRVLELAA